MKFSGAKLRAARKAKGLLQISMAAQLGLSYRTYQAVEAGKSVLNVDKAALASTILDVPLLDLFDTPPV